MNGDRTAELIVMALALTLPLSALITRRVPMKRAAGYAILWAAIILAVAVIIEIGGKAFGPRS